MRHRGQRRYFAPGPISRKASRTTTKIVGWSHGGVIGILVKPVQATAKKCLHGAGALGRVQPSPRSPLDYGWQCPSSPPICDRRQPVRRNAVIMPVDLPMYLACSLTHRCAVSAVPLGSAASIAVRNLSPATRIGRFKPVDGK